MEKINDPYIFRFFSKLCLQNMDDFLKEMLDKKNRKEYYVLCNELLNYLKEIEFDIKKQKKKIREIKDELSWNLKYERKQ